MRLELATLVFVLPMVAFAANDPPAEAEPKLSQEALELEVRQAALEVLAKDTEAKLAELTKLRREMESLLQPAEQEAEKDLTTLIQFYQSMKPKNAAALLEKLPPQLAADLLSAMKSRQAGKILDAMAPPKAVRISRLMAAGAR